MTNDDDARRGRRTTNSSNASSKHSIIRGQRTKNKWRRRRPVRGGVMLCGGGERRARRTTTRSVRTANGTHTRYLFPNSCRPPPGAKPKTWGKFVPPTFYTEFLGVKNDTASVSPMFWVFPWGTRQLRLEKGGGIRNNYLSDRCSFFVIISWATSSQGLS